MPLSVIFALAAFVLAVVSTLEMLTGGAIGFDRLFEVLAALLTDDPVR